MKHRSRSALPLFWLLAAVALLLRAGIPAGWMPEVSGSGIRVALCTASGPAELTLDAGGHWHKQAPGPANPRDPCPFGLVSAQAADLPLPPALAPIRLSGSVAPAAAPAVSGPAIIKLLRPPARGPPALA